jgi:hypothetical protein
VKFSVTVRNLHSLRGRHCDSIYANLLLHQYFTLSEFHALRSHAFFHVSQVIQAASPMKNSPSPSAVMTDSPVAQADPGLEADRFLAAIDVGTNSIHMVVVKIQPSIPAFTIIAKEKATVRLGDRDLQSGRLTVEAMERARTALRRCKEVAQSMNVEAIVGVATSAVREAANGRAFLEQIETELGLTIDLISGQEEARRIYLGVLSGMEFHQQPHVIIDIGGGSTN